jgi:hypothetical protein
LQRIGQFDTVLLSSTVGNTGYPNSMQSCYRETMGLTLFTLQDGGALINGPSNPWTNGWYLW